MARGSVGSAKKDARGSWVPVQVRLSGVPVQVSIGNEPQP